MPSFRKMCRADTQHLNTENAEEEADLSLDYMTIQQRIESIMERMSEEVTIFDPKKQEEVILPANAKPEEAVWEEGDEFLTEQELAQKRQERAFRAYQRRINQASEEEAAQGKDDEEDKAIDCLGRARVLSQEMHGKEREFFL